MEINISSCDMATYTKNVAIFYSVILQQDHHITRKGFHYVEERRLQQ